MRPEALTESSPPSVRWYWILPRPPKIPARYREWVRSDVASRSWPWRVGASRAFPLLVFELPILGSDVTWIWFATLGAVLATVLAFGTVWASWLRSEMTGFLEGRRTGVRLMAPLLPMVALIVAVTTISVAQGKL